MIVAPVNLLDMRWIEERTGCVLTHQARAIMAVDNRGIHGMIAYDTWTPNSCQAHMAVDSPVAWRVLLRPAFAYPFEEAGKQIIIAVIPARNQKSITMATHLGFQLVHRLKDAWSKGEDLLMLEMRKENCRWLESQRKAA